MAESIDKSHIVGHRIAGNAAPPNTMAALEKAVEMDLDWVEFDVLLTADKQLVVAHEKDLSTLLGEDMVIADHTFDELQEVDLARDFKGAKGEEHMPRFEEVVAFCKENAIRTQIELKASGDDAKELAERVVEVLNKPEFAPEAGMEPMVSSFVPDALIAVKEASGGKIETGLLIHTHEVGGWNAIADRVEPTYIHMYGGAFEEKIRLPQKFGDDVREAGYRLNAFKVNTIEDAKAAIDAGVERFTSDDPELLLGIDNTPAVKVKTQRDTSMDTVVIPVGGYGTRMGEITKAIPKAMLPVGSKPLIMHAVDEALEAGASRIIIPCRPEDEDLFNKQFFGSEGRREIIQQNKRDELLDEGNAFANVVEVVPIYAKEGPASTIAELVKQRGIGNFGVILPDDLIVGEKGALKQMLESFEQTGITTIGAREVEDREKSSNVTFVKMEEREDGLSVTTSVQIKPKKDDPVSKNATAGRYIFTADYVDVVEDIDKDGLKEVSMSAVVRHYATKKTPAQMGNDFSSIPEAPLEQQVTEGSLRDGGKQFTMENADVTATMEFEGVGVVKLSDSIFYDCGEMGGYMRATAAFMDADILRERFLEQNPNVSFLPQKKPEVAQDDVKEDQYLKVAHKMPLDELREAQKRIREHNDSMAARDDEVSEDEIPAFLKKKTGDHTSVNGQHEGIEMSNGVSLNGDADLENHDLDHLEETEVKAAKEDHGLT